MWLICSWIYTLNAIGNESDNKKQGPCNEYDLLIWRPPTANKDNVHMCVACLVRRNSTRVGDIFKYIWKTLRYVETDNLLSLVNAMKMDILLKKPTLRALGVSLLFALVIYTISLYKLQIIRSHNIDTIELVVQKGLTFPAIIERKLTNDISCHSRTQGDALPRLNETFKPPPKSIFMHETSCRGVINSRQACAVESAARAHPDWQVHMLFSGPITKNVLEMSCLSILKSYDNVKLLRINLNDYAKGTPVQSLVEARTYEKSTWRVEHLSDVMRYLTLYKYGGVYIDSDVIIVKPFDTLSSNWAGRESDTAVSAGFMSFSRDALGRQVAEAAIQDINKNYRPNIWGNNGPGVITRVVKGMCSKNYTSWIHGCNDFNVYDPIVFYPVYYEKNKQYFEADRVLNTSEKTYAHHFWNALTREYKIPKTSPYAKLAASYCPDVYAMYGDKFGV